jgi:ligand-binding sensor domain-containing protein
LGKKITDILLKAIMTGGIGVGGANAFWELFIKNDIPKALASALIGVGISYGAKMLMPIHKCNEERADRYQQLEEYLKAKEWRKADKETYRLMITAVGKDDGQGFSEDDFRNFPCDELLTIDRLWVKHSDGLYGFSVQKQIYEECGGKLDFTFPSNKTWNEFCDRVAWKDKGKYLTSYSDLFNKNFMRKFQQLEEYLKAKEWEKADQETYRLMMTAIGKEYGDWFSQDELRNFPCDELLAIDRLWVKHSNGLYGFSVQKQIYEECGGKLDFTFPTDDTWNKFCDRVAWKHKGSLTSYSMIYGKNLRKADQLKYNNSGHLPLGMKLYCVDGVFWLNWGGGSYYRGVVDFGWEVSFLASRLVNCSR